jgi:hypothetical protein
MLITLALAAALVLVWVRVVRTLTEQVDPQPPIGQPRAVVWNDRVFTTDRQLKRYLESKGVSYTRWVSKHPSAFAVIKHELPASATASRVPARTRAAKPAHEAAVRPKPSKTPLRARALADAPASRSSHVAPTTALVVALLLLETLLLVVAVLPARLAPESLRRFYFVPERRAGVVAAAATILIGLLVSLYLG